MISNSKKILGYIGIYITVLLFLVFLLFLSMLIPKKYVEKNASTSIVYMHNVIHDQRTKNIEEFKVSDDGDLRYSEMIYLVNEKKPLKSLIEMNSYILGYYTDLSTNNYSYHEYSRYWHGPILYLRPLMCLFNIETIYLINCILLLILVVSFTAYLFKFDKILSISFFLTSIAFTYIYTANNISYFNMIAISIIGAFIAIKLSRKHKNLSLLFLLLGLFTAFFDFYTIDTLTLIFPLMVILILRRKDKQKITFKEIIKYIIIWLIAYVFTFVLKWCVDYIYLGPEIIKDISQRAVNESYDASLGIRIWEVVNENFKLIIPFYFLKNYWLVLGPMIIIFIFNTIYYLDFKYYKSIYLLIIICFFRLFLVSVQSINLTFTTYRNLIPVFLFMTYIILYQIKNITRRI